MERVQWFQGVIVTAMACLCATTGLAAAEDIELRERFGEEQFAPVGGFILPQGQTLPVWSGNIPSGLPRWLRSRRFLPGGSTRSLKKFRLLVKRGGTTRMVKPQPPGPALRRAMTCCCVGKDVT